jgi:hypothetical protein
VILFGTRRQTSVEMCARALSPVDPYSHLHAGQNALNILDEKIRLAAILFTDFPMLHMVAKKCRHRVSERSISLHVLGGNG